MKIQRTGKGARAFCVLVAPAKNASFYKKTYPTGSLENIVHNW